MMTVGFNKFHTKAIATVSIPISNINRLNPCSANGAFGEPNRLQIIIVTANAQHQIKSSLI